MADQDFTPTDTASTAEIHLLEFGTNACEIQFPKRMSSADLRAFQRQCIPGALAILRLGMLPSADENTRDQFAREALPGVELLIALHQVIDIEFADRNAQGVGVGG